MSKSLISKFHVVSHFSSHLYNFVLILIIFTFHSLKNTTNIIKNFTEAKYAEKNSV